MFALPRLSLLDGLVTLRSVASHRLCSLLPRVTAAQTVTKPQVIVPLAIRLPSRDTAML